MQNIVKPNESSTPNCDNSDGINQTKINDNILSTNEQFDKRVRFIPNDIINQNQKNNTNPKASVSNIRERNTFANIKKTVNEVR